MPHITIVDFVTWPAFRELAVQIPAMQERMEWLMDMSVNIQCDWSFPTNEALVRDEETGLLDLCPIAKVRSQYHDAERCRASHFLAYYLQVAGNHRRFIELVRCTLIPRLCEQCRHLCEDSHRGTVSSSKWSLVKAAKFVMPLTKNELNDTRYGRIYPGRT